MRKELLEICIQLTFGITFLFYALDLSLVSCVSVGDADSVIDKVAFTNHCSEELGCFYTGPPFFDPVVRPISVPPVLDLKCEFQLFKRNNSDKGYNLEFSDESLRKSNFDSSLPTKFIIIGFNDELPKDDYAYIMKKELLLQGNYNVFVLNWTMHNKFPYEQVAANTRSVGALLGNMINFLLNKTEAKAKDFHLIGHSIGAHLSGYAGKRVNKLGRITGLDPAGPYFETRDRTVRLDRRDAQFVDIIHTSATHNELIGYGITKQIGHQDFYVNGGTVQPGCGIASRVGEEILLDGKNSSRTLPPQSCNHDRAWDLFIESINTTACHFQGVMCKSYEEFTSGKCTSRDSVVASMGIFAKPLKKKRRKALFYLDTTDHFPFCIN